MMSLKIHLFQFCFSNFSIDVQIISLIRDSAPRPPLGGGALSAPTISQFCFSNFSINVQKYSYKGLCPKGPHWGGDFECSPQIPCSNFCSICSQLFPLLNFKTWQNLLINRSNQQSDIKGRRHS